MRKYLGLIRSFAIDTKLTNNERMRFWHEQQRVEAYIYKIEKNVSIEFVPFDPSRDHWGGESGY